MRIDAVPEGILETTLSTLGLLPTPLMTVCWGMAQAQVIIAAVNLGVFDAVPEKGGTAAEVAQAISADPGAVEVLLNGLNGFGLVHRRNGVYRLTSSARKWLSRSSPSAITDAVAFGKDVGRMLERLEDVVRTGHRENFHDQVHPPEFWRRYMRGLATFARYVGAEVARKVKFDSPPRRLLDVAGGHGMYSVAMCRRWPELRAEVLDLPEAAVHGREIVGEQGFADRIVYRHGDLRRDQWGEGYDGLFLFNILHNLSEQEARAAITKARSALRPGGTLVILDGEHDGGEKDLNTAAGFGELFFYVISSSMTWPEPTLRSWVAGAGFDKVKRHRLLSMPQVLMLTARASGG